MNTQLENYYLSKPEPYQGCLLALRYIILEMDPAIMHERKFQIPFFTYKGKKLGYLWLNRKKLMLGLCTDKSLLSAAPDAKIKDRYESFEVNPNEDIPIEMIRSKLQTYLDAINRSIHSAD